MFDLEQAIADWCKQMLAAGIQSPVPLEELEIHLREEIDQRMKSGLNEHDAFEISARQIGPAITLKTEFAKAGDIVPEHLKQLFFALASIPNYQLATNMNTTNSNIEPRWVTYLKTAAFILPALFLWMASCVFVLPKLKDICASSGAVIPKFLLTAVAMSDLLENNLIILSVAFLVTLVLLEWRSRSWPRYRRLSFGIAAFSLNSTALIFITSLCVLAVFAGAELSLHTSPFMHATKFSPFTSVHFDPSNINKVTVTCNGSEYELAEIDNLPVTNILDFCRRQYGQPPFGEGWAQKRFAEDLVAVLSAMKHPANVDNTVRLTLVEPQTGRQKIIAHAKMTAENRAVIFQDRALENSNLLQSLPQK